MWQKTNFIKKKLQNWEMHSTIFKRLVVKPRSRGQALGGGPGGALNFFFGGCVPRGFQNVGSRERIFLEK